MLGMETLEKSALVETTWNMVMLKNCWAVFHITQLSLASTKEGFVLQIPHSWLQLYFNVQLQIYFIREQLGGPRTVTKWEYAATMSESLVSKNLIFVEIPLD